MSTFFNVEIFVRDDMTAEDVADYLHQIADYIDTYDKGAIVHTDITEAIFGYRDGDIGNRISEDLSSALQLQDVIHRNDL